MPDHALVEQGRRIYEEGILPNGESLQAMRPEGFTMEGSHAACVTCHRRSGMGSVEGNVQNTVLVPAVAGPVLFRPARFAKSFLDDAHHYVPNEAWRRALTRPAYNRKNLDRALRDGLDPGGRPLLAPMPRYALDDRAMAALTAYLRHLSSSVAAGVESDRLHLATIVTPDARPGQVEAVEGVLLEWSRSARGSGVAWRLHRWTLSGPPREWPKQLDAFYREQPVFAVLSGVGGAEWEPVHRFCEQFRVPCVLPSAEVAPDPETDYYSMYFSPGVGLEAGVLAGHLRQKPGNSTAEIVQVYSDGSGLHAAGTLQARLDTDSQVINRRYRLTAPPASIDGIDNEDSLVLWLRPAEIEQLAADRPQGPKAGAVYISALLADPAALVLPASWKRKTYFVSLFDDLSLHGEIARLRLEHWLEAAGLPADSRYRRLQADAYAAGYLFNRALGRIRDEEVRRPAVPLSREHLLETLETLVNKYDDSTGLVDTESHIAYYGRMSLGPRQRIAVRGGTLLRYVSTDSNRLTAASTRIVP